MLEEKNNAKHKQAKQQVFNRTEIPRLEAAAKGIDTYGNQRQTDGQYNSTADNRRIRLSTRPSTASKTPPIIEAPIIAP